MRKVILQECVSVDDLAAGPKGSVDLIPASTRDGRSLERHQLRFAQTIDLILQGKVTCQAFSEYWPNQMWETDPAAEVLNGTCRQDQASLAGRCSAADQPLEPWMAPHKTPSRVSTQRRDGDGGRYPEQALEPGGGFIDVAGQGIDVRQP